MADVTAGRGRDRGPNPFRADRVYLGWQYALLTPDPGPPPRRPTPPEQEQLNPEWVAAQRREENMLNRPLKIACGTALAFAAVLLTVGITGLLSGLLAAFGIIICLAGAVISGYAVWQGEQALRSRVGEEKQRLSKIRAEQESRLFAWQEEHKRRFHEWQQRKAAYDRQHLWYAASLPDAIDRVDVAGGTFAGWSAVTTMIGASRLSADGEVTVVDLSEGAAAADLVSVAQRSGIDPLVWVLPVDLPRLDIGAGLRREELADVLSLVVSVSEEHSSTRDLSYDNAILERVLDVFGGQAMIAEVTAALRALAQVGDPRDDVKLGIIQADHLERLAAMFGRGATDRVVIERAWVMESQLRKLENLGTASARLAPAPLRVVSTDRRAGVFGNKVLGTFVVTALTHMLRQAPVGRPWQHTVCLLGAERLRADVLDRLCDACENTRTGLVLAYRSVPGQVRERLGRGNAAVAFMRLGNAEDAHAASEQIGTDHQFVLSQFTETVGTAVTDTAGDSYTSTVGTADSISTSTSTTETAGRSRGHGFSHESLLMPFGRSTRSRSRDASYSSAASDSESLTKGITASTAWGVSTSRALGTNQSFTRSSQRSREFLVEQHELQQLPPSALIITHAAPDGRHIVLADANPAILALPTATLLTLEEARLAPPAETLQARPAVPAGPARPAASGVPAGSAGSMGSADAGGTMDTGAAGGSGAIVPAGAGGAMSGSAASAGPAGAFSAAGAGGAGGMRGWRPEGQSGPGEAPGWPAAAQGWPGGVQGRPAAAQGGPGGVQGRPAAAQAGPAGGPQYAGGHHDDPGIHHEGGVEPAGAVSPPGGTDPAGGGAAPAPVSWQGEDQPPPNLGPPPARLDWRKKPRDDA